MFIVMYLNICPLVAICFCSRLMHKPAETPEHASKKRKQSNPFANHNCSRWNPLDVRSLDQLSCSLLPLKHLIFLAFTAAYRSHAIISCQCASIWNWILKCNIIPHGGFQNGIVSTIYPSISSIVASLKCSWFL